MVQSFYRHWLSAFAVSCFSVSVLAVNNGTSYVVDGAKKQVNQAGLSQKDIRELANSVEFEVYNLSEEGSSRSIFISGAGVCHGFVSRNGVDLTNTTNYYVTPDNEDEYYGGIVGATIYQKGKSRNVQYVPVYSVSDPKKMKEIREQEAREGKNMHERAQPQLDEAKDTLNRIICIKE
ncbi:Uncharacterised protein [Haemophilus pittmaniae]|uniref:DUF8095 domain-containing protein n=2 Tax=Haemophilus pittmaniae TaxID=249188 RepID=A0A377IYY1_9PAST|nr:hypothetical protein [Haemophilus pittmaniae]STO93309.1 Uncharacterised protein [Haemophilus pittmaniae]